MLEEAVDGGIELVVPDLVLDELERVLGAKLGFDAGRLLAAREFLEGLAADRPGHPRSVEPVTGDPGDDAILASAIEERVDVLVTGDRRHLLPIRERGDVRLMTPQALLAELRGAERGGPAPGWAS